MPGYYYDLLGVPDHATTDEIRSAYRQRAALFHPDRNPGDEVSSQMFIEIGQAYEVLSDEVKRKRYDASMTPRKGFLDEIREIGEQAASFLDGLRSQLEPKPLHKRSQCPACRGTGEAMFEIGPIRVASSCSSCEEETSSTASRNRA